MFINEHMFGIVQAPGKNRMDDGSRILRTFSTDLENARYAQNSYYYDCQS